MTAPRAVDLRTDVAARHGIGSAVEYFPLGKRLDVVLVEFSNPSSVKAPGERNSQAQNDVSGRPAA